jgi:mono/diheme cytochrome c family protein
MFQQCTGCHRAKASENKVGPSLQGLFKRRNLLNGRAATEQNIRLRIQNGGDGMPPFQQILSAKEIDQVIAYLRKL